MPSQLWSNEEYVEALLSDIENDYLGLWEVSHLLHGPGVPTVAARRELGMNLVRDLVSQHGLIPGFLTEGGFVLWLIDPIDAVARIDREWRELGRDPNISEVCWFKVVSHRTATLTRDQSFIGRQRLAQTRARPMQLLPRPVACIARNSFCRRSRESGRRDPGPVSSVEFTYRLTSTPAPAMHGEGGRLTYELLGTDV